MAEVAYKAINGTFKTTALPRNPSKPNFVICCEYGDWSGFRTLAECESQYAEIEKSRPDKTFWVEER